MTTHPPEDWLSQMPPFIRDFVEKVKSSPDFPRQLLKFALILMDKHKKEAQYLEEMAFQAWKLAPDNPRMRLEAEGILGGRVPRWHIPIVNDDDRNSVYDAAIRRYVTPETTVLEVGTGSGIMAMMAARAGARHVYTCEMEPLLADVARQNIRNNGYQDRITIIPKKSSDLVIGADLPEPATMLLSEVLDNNLLGEHVLPTVEDAIARLLKPGATIIPARIAAQAALVGGPEWSHYYRAERSCGLDLTAMNALAPTVVFPDVRTSQLDLALSDVFELFAFDFRTRSQFESESVTREIRVARDGRVDGLMQWISLEFDASLRYENRPPRQSAWQVLLHVFATPTPVKAGATFALQMEHNKEQILVWPA